MSWSFLEQFFRNWRAFVIFCVHRKTAISELLENGVDSDIERGISREKQKTSKRPRASTQEDGSQAENGELELLNGDEELELDSSRDSQAELDTSKLTGAARRKVCSKARFVKS